MYYLRTPFPRVMYSHVDIIQSVSPCGHTERHVQIKILITEKSKPAFVIVINVRGIINAALASLGVGFVPRYTILKELEKRLLVELFSETEVRNDQINIYVKRRNFEKQAFKDVISHIKSIQLH